MVRATWRVVSGDGLRFMLLPSNFSTDDLRAWLTFADETPEIRVLTGMPVVWDEMIWMTSATEDGKKLYAIGVDAQDPEIICGGAQDNCSVASNGNNVWSLQAVTVIHRVGEMYPGEPIVLVLTASAHRQDAFDACQYIMDILKTEAPFWKKEVLPDGSHHPVE